MCIPAHAGVPQHRWGVFLNDFDQFIHGRGGWAERAADLGWDTLALFGCHPTRPLDPLNGAGLPWRISGGKISSMRTDWATIEIDGARRPTSCCRGGDQHLERYCSQKEKRGRPENPRQSFPSQTNPSPAGFLLRRPENG
jgi:hypothetical protein